MIHSLFVYGTLKQNQLRGSMWPHPPVSIETAVTRGELYDLGSYPGMAMGSDWVLGELWTLQPHHIQATLQTLDSIEGYDPKTDSGPYLRRTIELRLATDGLATDRRTAYTYIVASPAILHAARRICATVDWKQALVASWPDALAHVPQRIEDE